MWNRTDSGAALTALFLAWGSLSCGGGGSDTPSPVTPTPKPTPTGFSASFDSYDTSRWAKSDWANGNPFNCGWSPDHISFANGVMTLTLDDTSSHGKPYASGEYQSLSTFSYGTYEANMKAAKAPGIVSSFFLYTGTPWDEIDFEILGKDTTQVQLNYYVNGVGGHEKLIDLGFDASADFHKYKIEWDNGIINWYVDGVLKYGVDNQSGAVMPSHPMKVMVNLWPGTGADAWLGTFGYSTPLTASYDYIKFVPK